MTGSDDAIASESGGQTPTEHRRGPRKRFCKASLTALCLTLMLAAAPAADACTRVLHETGTGTYIVGRNMDWNDLTMETDFWVFPRGMERNGGVGPDSIAWTSKRGRDVCYLAQSRRASD